MKEFSIMPQSPYYETERFPGSERHEVFEGYISKNRDYSIEDGLVIFITPDMHRTSKSSIHKNPKFWKETVRLQELAEQAWIEHYGKTKDEFRQRYGKNYL